MAQGKNKVKAKKGKKKPVDAFQKKEWVHLKAPNLFNNQREIGRTVANKTIGTKTLADNLKNRVVDVSMANLYNNEAYYFRKLKFRVDDVKGKDALTNFYGLEFTTDKVRSLVRKWHTKIEAAVDVKTLDGYYLRVFCVGFTRRHRSQRKKTTYAKASQQYRIRQKMFERIQAHAAKSNMKEFVRKVCLRNQNSKGDPREAQFGQVAADITNACTKIYPMRDICIRKVKVVKAPRVDLARLAELHHDATEDTGKRKRV
eukprot:gb/GECH01011018.1/.p1 GENE.gb/GECH01011018.1/~~gb/GECH01011018.1/.p1  ORF type:complete len:258 (+),score=36.55 gb/GECH01011018.1/:1-774(+)